MDAAPPRSNYREMKIQRAENAAILAGHAAATKFFESCFDENNGAREQLWVAHVDEGACCIHLEKYGDGREATVELPVRLIISDAARLGSAGIFLAHNHPSGDAAPSTADCQATRKLARAAEAIDLALVDHLIFGAGHEVASMRRMGLL